jgi:hypothetical protein
MTTTTGHRGEPSREKRRGLLDAFVRDYVRNPVNTVFLVLVPTVFVLLAADALTDAAALLTGRSGAPVQTATAGWAASFLVGVAVYFQVSANRGADRRLVLDGLPAARLAAARLACGAVVAVAVTLVAFAALVLAEAGDAVTPARVLAGTLLAALVYLGIGAVIGAVFPDPVSGSVVLLFVWILDVFFGPVLGAGTDLVWRVLPTHFVTLWTVDLPSGHAGRPGDLGWALLAVVVALAAAVVAVRPRRARPPHRRSTRRQTATGTTGSGPGVAQRAQAVPSRANGQAHDRAAPAGLHASGRAPRPRAASQSRVGLSLAVRGLARTPALWLLLVAVPAVFVLLAAWTTPSELMPMLVTENGVRVAVVVDLADIHGGTMAPVAVASLAMVAGLFAALQTRSPDRRLLGVGFDPVALLGARALPVVLAATTAVAATLATTAFVFDAANWTVYAAGNLLLAITYGLLGLMAGPLLGRVAGVFVAFLVPFVDVALGQSPMLNPAAPGWAELLPGHGAYRVLMDGALTSGFDQAQALVVASTWAAALLVVAWLTVVAQRPRRA